jgi:hypothetical protein
MIRVHGRLQRRTIGRYPVISLAQARQAAMAMLRDAAQGIDPRQPKAEAVTILTFADTQGHPVFQIHAMVRE